jgi:hypothetical protein
VYDKAPLTGAHANVTGFVFTAAPSAGDCSVAGPIPVPDKEVADVIVSGAMVTVAV